MAFAGISAQTANFSLKGKTVAVYLSKKQFSFDDSYLLELSQFIKAHRGMDEQVDDVKVETLVCLGELLKEQLVDSLGAQEAWFLNERAEAAQAFIDAYDMARGRVSPVRHPDLDGTDLVMVVNPMILGNYSISEVYVRSNRIINEPKRVRTARIGLKFFNPASGKLVYQVETCFDQRNDKVPLRVDLHNATSNPGKFMARLFSKAIVDLESGVSSGCGE